MYTPDGEAWGQLCTSSRPVVNADPDSHYYSFINCARTNRHQNLIYSIFIFENRHSTGCELCILFWSTRLPNSLFARFLGRKLYQNWLPTPAPMLRPRWLGLQTQARNAFRKRYHTTDLQRFAVNDHVVVENLHDRRTPPTLLHLKAGGKRDTHRGCIHHDDIIGKRAREVVQSRASKHKTDQQGFPFRIYQVRLEEYVRLTRRLVTPLYPQDAQLIVSLLDLHPEPKSASTGMQNEGPALEILEAGTGHGALTLYLSRAIHAANAPIPRREDAAHSPSSESDDEAFEEVISRWKTSRNAVVHSIELNAKHSAHAEKIVYDFRHAMYHSNVDFHVGSVGRWVTAELMRRSNEPFLSHALLDLPGSEDHLPAVGAALRAAGTLIVFNPSLTQITDCLTKVKEGGLDLELEKVIELGVNGGTGGREWDVRAVMPRSAAGITENIVEEVEKVEEDVTTANQGLEEVDAEAVEERDDGFSSLDESPYPLRAQAAKVLPKTGWKTVCRPKVGELTVGGGFLAVFSKRQR
nr:trna (adenine(58)-n(1))-methyltransferase trmi [Quercus suber]